jgi:serine/threonine protein kinase
MAGKSGVAPSCLIKSSGLFLTATSDAIVMNLVTGSPFFVYLCEETSYTETSVAIYMKQILQGLQYLHSKNIVHLDLKPENLVVDASKKTIYLIDFGAAQEIQSGKQHISSSSYIKHYSNDQDQCGTNLEFMAPEMLSNGPVGRYTDMWGFGVLLYVSLSGKSPFLDDSDEETKTNILRCDFSFPNEYFSNVSSQAKELIQQCLCTDQNSRTSASCCLESTWLSEVMKHNPSEHLGVGNKRKYAISSMHLCDLVRRRMKKLNSVAPLLLAPSPSRIPRPESLYR